ncbi:hypothetical protein [Longimicrobium sp.]|uniref:hypothetical protein n=1 Tax=Longimicrobium sp. TaxID=2029185 RepID=UPI002C039140|nr:hypothetical protein [Longimicrobium sp.]HSU17336.1 hypothetical protein [Longimicrobium sp.]
MEDLQEVKAVLDEINNAISSYDPVLKERARDILLERAFGGRVARGGAAPRAQAEPAGDAGAAGEEQPRRRGRPRGSTNARRNGAGGVSSAIERWKPETMAERALLGAWVLARGRADRTVTSQAINAELKRNGLPVPNITRAIESNLRSRPPLMVQKKKMGTTRQARKQYALTQEGVDLVEGKLSGS